MSESLLPTYLADVTHYLETEEPQLWDWFASAKVKSEHGDNVRLQLLKSTYRIDPQTQSHLYAIAQGVAEKLGIERPITLYQGQQINELNASLAYIPDEPHVIFYGPLLKTLQDEEIAAVLGHELYHFQLWERDEQRYFTAYQILEALAQDHQADACYLESVRLFSLFTEVYCDRGAYLATDNLNVAVSAMVKMVTGLDAVSAEAYLQQADEILEKHAKGSMHVTHPESFLRTKALAVWQEQQDEGLVMRLIRGPVALGQLDVLEKESLSRQTRALIELLLQYPWMRTEAVLAHARQFFHDFQTTDNQEFINTNQTQLHQALKAGHKSVKDYLCYVMLDFAAVDQSLDEAPLAHCLLLSESLGVMSHFSEMVRKELGLTKKALDTLSASAADLLDKLAASGETHE